MNTYDRNMQDIQKKTHPSLLFQDGWIGKNHSKNRIVRSATNDHLCNIDGRISDEQIALYDNLAKNNVGIIITGHFAVDEQYKTAINQPLLSDDSYIVSAKRLSDQVHRYNCLIYGQISQGGINAYDKKYDINTVEAEKLQKTISQFAEAAYRLKSAGYDGVQLHLAHRYLLANLLDNSRNRRSDKYGGTKENRFRLIREIIQAVKDRCQDFSIIVKMNATNEMLTSFDEDLLYYAKELSACGIDAIELSGPDFKEHTKSDRAYYVRQALLIKESIDIPVILVGGLSDKETMESVLAQGIDYVSCCRPFICQPDYVTRLLSGQESSPCVSCWSCVKNYKKTYKNCIYLEENQKIKEIFG